MATTNKLRWCELNAIIDAHNRSFGVSRQYEDSTPLICAIVFTEDSFSKHYSEKSRTYTFRSDEKFFLPRMNGASIFADCLDGTDKGVRIDWYLFTEWKIEYCYIYKDLSKHVHSSKK